MNAQQSTGEIALKQVLSLDEVVSYTGFSRRYLLKLVGLRKLPAYKPGGKALFFNRLELESWLQSNRIATSTELEAEAQVFCDKNKGGRK